MTVPTALGIARGAPLPEGYPELAIKRIVHSTGGSAASSSDPTQPPPRARHPPGPAPLRRGHRSPDRPLSEASNYRFPCGVEAVCWARPDHHVADAGQSDRQRTVHPTMLGCRERPPLRRGWRKGSFVDDTGRHGRLRLSRAVRAVQEKMVRSVGLGTSRRFSSRSNQTGGVGVRQPPEIIPSCTSTRLSESIAAPFTRLSPFCPGREGVRKEGAPTAAAPTASSAWVQRGRTRA